MHTPLHAEHLRTVVPDLPPGWVAAALARGLVAPDDAADVVARVRSVPSRLAVATAAVEALAPGARSRVADTALALTRVPASMEWPPLATHRHLPAWKAVMTLLPHASRATADALRPAIDAVEHDASRAILRALRDAHGRDARARLDAAESARLLDALAQSPSVLDRAAGLAAAVRVVHPDAQRAALDRLIHTTTVARWPGARAAAAAALVHALVACGTEDDLALAERHLSELVAPESLWYAAALFARAPDRLERGLAAHVLRRATDEPEVIRALGPRLGNAARAQIALEVFARTPGARPSLQRLEVVGAALEGADPIATRPLLEHAIALVLADGAATPRIKLLALEPLLGAMRDADVLAVLASCTAAPRATRTLAA